MSSAEIARTRKQMNYSQIHICPRAEREQQDRPGLGAGSKGAQRRRAKAPDHCQEAPGGSTGGIELAKM